eukprot:356121_1
MAVLRKEIELVELCVYGYLRDFDSTNILSQPLPMELANVILIYYPRNRFKFINKANNKHISITNEGYTAIYGDVSSSDPPWDWTGDTPTYKRWVTLQIGDFLSNKEKIIHTITFKLTTHDRNSDIVGYNSIGFISKEFKLFESTSWNPGKNGSVSLSSNGYFVTSECFDKKYVNHGMIVKAIYAENDEVMIKIDTNKMKAILWNSTPPEKSNIKRLTDMDVDGEYNKYKNYYYKFDLPNDIPSALALELGKSQIVNILKHEIAYMQ